MKTAILLALAFLFGSCGDTPCTPKCVFVAPQGTASTWHYTFPLGFSRTVEQRYSVVASCLVTEQSWWKDLTEKEAWARVCNGAILYCPDVPQAVLDFKCREARAP